MNKLIIITALLIISCDDEETKDPLVGRWSGTFTEAGLTVSFEIIKQTPNYDFQNITINNEAWVMSEFGGVSLTQDIDIIMRQSSTKTLTYSNCDVKGDKMTCEQAIYNESGKPAVFTQVATLFRK
jgi:uncharacterized lipoprotein YehR (DUF1307 family)